MKISHLQTMLRTSELPDLFLFHMLMNMSIKYMVPSVIFLHKWYHAEFILRQLTFLLNNMSLRFPSPADVNSFLLMIMFYSII